MSNLFSQVLNMSMTGSVVILLVMLARLILNRAPKIFSYALWSVVLFRLLCPVAFTAPVSVLKVAGPAVQEAGNNISVVSYIPASIDTQADFIAVQPDNLSSNQVEGSEPKEQLRMTPMHAVALIWVVGTVGMILYSVAQYLILRRKLVGSMHLQDNIYLTDYINTAFVVGVFQPRIYLPSNVPSKERYYILAHEQHHIRRFDHVIKLLAYLALCIHWFNPLVWIAFVLAGKDMEMSCDEAVIKKLGEEIRADYSASLLRLATHKKILSGMPLAFGEGDTKSRVINMVRWKKPTKWIVVICVILCLCILAVCVFNPEKRVEQSITDITRHTYNGLTNISIGDLCFDYPAGLTSEQRDVDNWNEEDRLRSLRDLPHRRPFNCFFIDNETDFGGVVDFIVPDDREINLEEMNLPYEWVGLDYIAGSSTYPYAEMEYTLIKDGKDYIQMYLYTYSGRGYFLWFYTEQGNPAHKVSILESVELGSFSTMVTKLKRDEIVSLGQFNVTIPKGYGYHCNETKMLEITKKNFYGKQNVIACVTTRPNPNHPMDTEEDLIRWVEAAGIDLSGEGIFSELDDKAEYGDVYVTIHDVGKGKPVIDEEHFLFISGNTVYDLCIGPGAIDSNEKAAILQSIWINDSMAVPYIETYQPASTAASAGEKLPATDVEIAELPDGFSRIFNETGGIFFVRDNTIVGGVDAYPLPKEIYDPHDPHFLWLEMSGISDFGDSSLCYMGGMTFSGTGIWEAQFASDVSDGVEPEVERYHSFKVVGELVYDIWYDMKQLTRDQSFGLLDAVILPEGNGYMATEPFTDEDVAFEKIRSIYDALQNDASAQILVERINDGNEGPKGYATMHYWHEGNWLGIQERLTEGTNTTEAGAYFNRQAYMIVDDALYSNEGHWGETGDIQWHEGAENGIFSEPTLTSFVWSKSYVTYIDTIENESGICYMYRIDKMFDDIEGYTDHYFANYYFDTSGNFLNAQFQVNLFQDNAFAVTESIVSLDPETVNAEIQKEYQRAIGK